MPTTDDQKQRTLKEKGSKLNALSTFVLLLGVVFPVFTDSSLIALTILVVGLWLYTWALHLAPLYTFFEKNLLYWKRCRFILLITLIIATLLLIVVTIGKRFFA